MSTNTVILLLPASKGWRKVHPIPGLDGGIPHPVMDGGYPMEFPHPGQVLGQDGRYPVVPPSPGLDEVPPVGTGWETPIQVWLGYHPSRSGWGTPLHQETEQHSKHLLRGGQYASCVCAGGLSCYQVNIRLSRNKHPNGLLTGMIGCRK